MEIGSFLELQFPKGLEYYRQKNDIIRLNTGRAAIWHAFRLTGADRIWIPYYQCDSVRDFLCKKGVDVLYYSMDRHFNPVDLHPDEDDAVLLVNYFGVMSASRMAELAHPYPHAIIDNCQAFFSAPLAGLYNVYSARKFVGVPDGAYVLGPDAELFSSSYPQGYSSDTAQFLLQRIEYGCEGKGYEARMINEHRIDSEDVMKMSPLTRAILDGTDYLEICEKRRANFSYAHSLFGRVNQIDAMRHYDGETVPMVYPLVVEDDALLNRLLQAKHFQGHWWSYLLDEVPADSFEYWMSRYMIPVTIDQRYGRRELDYLADIIL
ncbi:MAG: hypothetical protein J6T35_00570 [Bacteroidales bacterium]|nr:hypothetical protein [Bacteroidales bacterium]